MKIGDVKDHISYSSISKYLRCPRQWYYDYVVAPEKKEENLSLTLGTVYHTALERLYSERDYEAGLAAFNEISANHGRRAHREVEGIMECYKQYYLSVYPKYASRVESVELKGTVAIPGVEVPLEYRMDLVTTDGIIIDHKTVGRMEPDLEHSLQFDLYAYVFYKQNGVLPRGAEYHYAYKDSGKVKVVSKVPKISEMLKAVACAEGMAKGVEADNFMPTYGKHCEWCPYKELCDREFGLI